MKESNFQPAGSSNLNEDLRAAGKLNERRRLLVGGAVFAGFMTVSNRSALASDSRCGPSQLASLAPSHTINGNCGDSPDRWSGPQHSSWQDGATFNGQPLPYTHSTDIRSVFSSLNSAPFTVSGGTLDEMIQGKAAIGVDLYTSKKHLVAWDSGLVTPGEQQDLAAALLNEQFYGSRYCSNVTTLINNCFMTVSQLAYQDDGKNTDSIEEQVQQCISNLDAQLKYLNQQGDSCSVDD